MIEIEQSFRQLMSKDQIFIIPKSMPILQKDSYIFKSFHTYFASTTRVAFELNQITELLKIELNPFLIVDQIYKQFAHSSPIDIFKWLILSNKLIMEFVIGPTDMALLLERMQCNEENQFEELLNQKLIKPYRLYLMKRCQFLPKRSQPTDRMFQLMNLIQAGTSFSEIIYTLGRYYGKVYPFSADFNIVLGSDLTTVYNQMVKYTPKPASSEILFQYERIHQKMYIVYYNCYFYKCLKPYVPRWVVTDIVENNGVGSSGAKYGVKTPATQQSIKNSSMIKNTSCCKNINRKLKYDSSTVVVSSNAKVRDSSIVSQFDMSNSAIFSLSSQQQTKSSKQLQQSLLLLRSMQRVFEELNQF